MKDKDTSALEILTENIITKKINEESISNNRSQLWQWMLDKYPNNYRFITLKQRHIDEFIEQHPNTLTPDDIEFIQTKYVGDKLNNILAKPKQRTQGDWDDTPEGEERRRRRNLNKSYGYDRYGSQRMTNWGY